MKFEEFSAHIIDMSNELWPGRRGSAIPNEPKSRDELALKIKEIATIRGIWTPSGCTCRDEDVWCSNFQKHPLVLAMRIMYYSRKSSVPIYAGDLIGILECHATAWQHFEKTAK